MSDVIRHRKPFIQSCDSWLIGNNRINIKLHVTGNKKKVSEYDQEIPQSQTADNPVAPRGRAAQPSRDTR